MGEHWWLVHVCGSVLRSVAVQLGKEGKAVLSHSGVNSCDCPALRVEKRACLA